jgi:hypothetical protein
LFCPATSAKKGLLFYRISRKKRRKVSNFSETFPNNLATNRRNRNNNYDKNVILKGINMVLQILASGAWVGLAPFIMMIAFFALLFWYLLNKKRLEHQQIMAAIEKGTPLSELKPVEKKGADWIKSLTVGIAFLLIGIGLAIVVLSVIFAGGNTLNEDTGFRLFIAAIFLAIGIAGIIRGILRRKYDKAISSDKSALNTNNGQ